MATYPVRYCCIARGIDTSYLSPCNNPAKIPIGVKDILFCSFDNFEHIHKPCTLCRCCDVCAKECCGDCVIISDVFVGMTFAILVTGDNYV